MFTFLAASPISLLYWKILDGKFWMLDDHVFVENSYLVSENENIWSRFKVLLDLNNVSLEPNNLRITPTLNLYYALRTFFFDTNPVSYFILAFAIFLLSGAALTYLLILIIREFPYLDKSQINYPGITFIAFTIFSFPTVARNYVTLGVSEQIGPLFLFLTYILLLLSTKQKDRSKSIIVATLLPLNTIIFIGIKENYAAMSLILLLASAFYFKKMRTLNRLSVVFSILLNISFVIVLKMRLLGSKVDVYGNSTDASVFFTSFLNVFSDRFFILHVAFLLVLSYSNFSNKVKVHPLIYTPPFLFIIDWVIYRGDLRDRYLTNAIILIYLFLMIAVISLKLRERGSLIIGVLISATILVGNWSDAQSVIARQIEATVHFNSGVNHSVNLARSSSTVAVIGQSEWDYESVDSIAIYLRAHGVKKSMYLYLPDKFVKKTELSNQMRFWSESGSTYKFNPLPKLTRRFDLCIFSQSIVEDYPDLKCSHSSIIRWLP
jgi:hypothetical protein